MWLARLLARLWAARTAVAAVLGLALVAGLLASFRIVVGLPPSIESKRYTVAIAGITLQVDTVRSLAVDGGGKTGSDIRTLSDRAALLGALLGTGPVRQSIARSLDLPAQRVVITTAMTFQERTRTLQRDVAVPAAAPRGGILIDVLDPRLDEGFSPILQLQTEAPTAKLAVAAAEVSVRALRRYAHATAVRDGVPPARRLVFRSLEPARYGELARGPGRLLGIVVALGVFAGGCALVLYGKGLLEELRRRGPATVGGPARPPRPPLRARRS